MTKAGARGGGTERCDNGQILTSPPTIFLLFDKWAL